MKSKSLERNSKQVSVSIAINPLIHNRYCGNVLLTKKAFFFKHYSTSLLTRVNLSEGLNMDSEAIKEKSCKKTKINNVITSTDFSGYLHTWRTAPSVSSSISVRSIWHNIPVVTKVS